MQYLSACLPRAFFSEQILEHSLLDMASREVVRVAVPHQDILQEYS